MNSAEISSGQTESVEEQISLKRSLASAVMTVRSIHCLKVIESQYTASGCWHCLQGVMLRQMVVCLVMPATTSGAVWSTGIPMAAGYGVTVPSTENRLLPSL